MGKTAFVFSGQGAQYTGMGKEIYECSPAARAVFDMAESIRPGTIKQCFEGSKEELSVTINTQPCVFITDLAAAAAVKLILLIIGMHGLIPDPLILASDSLAGTALTVYSLLSFRID